MILKALFIFLFFLSSAYSFAADCETPFYDEATDLAHARDVSKSAKRSTMNGIVEGVKANIQELRVVVARFVNKYSTDSGSRAIEHSITNIENRFSAILENINIIQRDIAKKITEQTGIVSDPNSSMVTEMEHVITNMKKVIIEASWDMNPITRRLRSIMRRDGFDYTSDENIYSYINVRVTPEHVRIILSDVENDLAYIEKRLEQSFNPEVTVERRYIIGDISIVDPAGISYDNIGGSSIYGNSVNRQFTSLQKLRSTYTYVSATPEEKTRMEKVHLRKELIIHLRKKIDEIKIEMEQDVISQAPSEATIPEMLAFPKANAEAKAVIIAEIENKITSLERQIETGQFLPEERIPDEVPVWKKAEGFEIAIW